MSYNESAREPGLLAYEADKEVARQEWLEAVRKWEDGLTDVEPVSWKDYSDPGIYQYPGADVDLEAFNKRVTQVSEPEYSPLDFEVHEIPISYDPRYESTLWHEDFSKANCLSFDQLKFAKDVAAEMFDGLNWENSTHSGFVYLKIDGTYYGTDGMRWEKPFIGTIEDITVRKSSITASLRDCLVRYQSKFVNATKPVIADFLGYLKELDRCIIALQVKDKSASAKTSLLRDISKKAEELKAIVSGDVVETGS